MKISKDTLALVKAVQVHQTLLARVPLWTRRANELDHASTGYFVTPHIRAQRKLARLHRDIQAEAERIRACERSIARRVLSEALAKI